MKRSISYDCDSMTDRLSATEIIIRNSGKGAVPEEQTGLSLFFDFGTVAAVSGPRPGSSTATDVDCFL